MTSAGAGSSRAALWSARHTATDGGVVIVGTAGTEFPDGSVVSLPGPAVRPARWQFEATVPVPGSPPSRVAVAPDVAPRAPHLWAVLLPADRGDQVDLAAFSTDSFPDGTLVGPRSVEALGISWANQVAAVRWSPSSGVVGQIYVSPTHRRRGVATKLLMLAGGVRVAMGWSPLRSDGRLTDLGDAWLRRSPEQWQGRLTARTAHLPAMTTPEEAVGVPARNLVPDPD